MTAEIAICNANGIALAADSAVSMGDGHKIYNTANKLFSLSKYHPVAIMVYNSGSLLGVPWETIIKQYRKELGDTEFGQLSNYGDHFWEYIQTKSSWFPQQDVESFISAKIRRLLTTIKDQFIAAAIDEHINSDDEENLRKVLVRKIDEFYQIFSDMDFALSFSEQDVADARENNREIFQRAFEEVLENSYTLLAEDQKDRLAELCAISLTRNYFDHYSGVVIAGFGSEEIHPKVVTYKAGIVVNSKLRIMLDKTLSNIHREVFIPEIFPYAQDDVVRSFIEGVDPEIDNYLQSLFRQLEAIASQIPTGAMAGDNSDFEASRELIRATIANYAEQLTKDYKKAKFELGTSELLAMLSVLPKDELAEMAESLVNLTAFKRRMTAAKESVGGPIDVAILSKGDGFIWIKRKHYFKSELNQNFFHNYYQE